MISVSTEIPEPVNKTPMDDSWIDFYTKFADSLLPYKNDRKQLIEKVQKAYKSVGIKFPKVENDSQVYDLDPFTIYGFFNKGITKQNRKRLIGSFIQEFQVDSQIPTSFDSLPVLINLSASFFRFKEVRDVHEIDHLWDLFSSALAYAENPTDSNKASFMQSYNIVREQPGIRWNLTMGLYWIRPYTFLALDSRNRWFFQLPEFVPENIRNKLPKFNEAPDAQTYLDTVKIMQEWIASPNEPYNSFPELSYAAWIESERVNKELKKKENNTDGKTNALSDRTVPKKRFWTYAPGKDASKWDDFYASGIMALGWDELGDYSQYDSKKAIREKMLTEFPDGGSMKHSAYAAWQFCHDIQVGDVIFAKKGRTEIVGRGVVTSEYIYDEDRDSYKNVHNVDWTQKGSWKLESQISMKTLTDITSYTETVNKIESLFDQEEEETEPPVIRDELEPYSRDEFLEDVFMDPDAYDQLVYGLEQKKNIILQGPPGVGKTYAAKRLAYSLMGVKDPERVVMIQFHQSYSYEDFIMGFRPTLSGFELKKGIFYSFCRTAEEDLENDYFFIIDEINRGNLSKIFGELFMLLENDKRGIPMQLLYSDEQFTIPENVYIIGMMNTADRSLAIMDFALRRRFAFIEMNPGYQTDGFQAYQKQLNDSTFDRLISTIEDLNKEIEQDASLGPGFRIGHSYVCNLKVETLENSLHSIVEFELIPLLKEYWFDDSQKVQTWSDRLRRSIQ